MQTRLFKFGIATGLGEGKLWIQTKPGKRWSLLGYSCPKHTTKPDYSTSDDDDDIAGI